MVSCNIFLQSLARPNPTQKYNTTILFEIQDYSHFRELHSLPLEETVILNRLMDFSSNN